MTEKDALQRARSAVLATRGQRPVALTFAEAVALLTEANKADAADRQVSVDDFRKAVDRERASHPLRGYDEEHDRGVGVSHLLRWAIDYASRGKAVQSGSLIMAALKVASIEERERYEARAAIDGVLKLHKAVGFDIDDEGTLDPDNDCCDYCSERDGEAVIYPCETVRALDGAIKPSGVLK